MFVEVVVPTVGKVDECLGEVYDVHLVSHRNVQQFVERLFLAVRQATSGHQNMFGHVER